VRRNARKRSETNDDATDALLGRWHDRLEPSQLDLRLPADGEARMSWVYTGSSESERNRQFLRRALPDTHDELLAWLSEPSAPPAFWSEGGKPGVRLPFELGPRGWVGTPGIPEDLTEYVPLIKIAVIGDAVVTSLGLVEDIVYDLPASLVPDWPPRLDEWSLYGSAAFAEALLLALLADIAWHHTAIQTFVGADWHAQFARSRMESTIITEAHLAELRVQHDVARTDNAWFVGSEADERTVRINRTLGLCFDRLRNARELARDDIQLAVLRETHELSVAEGRHRHARDREARATEALTRRITLVSALFLPATLIVGLLGANWAEDPLPGGWVGLAVAAACVAATMLLAWAFLRRLASSGGRIAASDPASPSERRSSDHDIPECEDN
jgi:hypothetical protein